MAYDRYDTRRDPRERWSSEERYDRERGRGGRDERGFFERAGEEIASWFGDDDDRSRGQRDDRGDMNRDRDWRGGRDHWRDREPTRAPGHENRWNRDESSGRGRGRWRDDDEDRGMFGRSGSRGFGDRQSSGSSMWSGGNHSEPERGYRPMTGDYGRTRGDDDDFSRSQWGRDDYRRTSFAGSSDRSNHPDPHYAEWRQRQLSELDRDYDEYRREHQSKFESDFGDWRSRRQGKRQMLAQVREHMEVVGSDDQHVGTVDRVAGDRIILTKSDAEAGGAHHSLPCTLIDRIEENRVILDCDAEQAKSRWRDESRERALFEREDQGEAGPMTLDRSFSGTYR